MQPAQPRFTIFAYGYKQDVGGIIVLHKLCDQLNRLGYAACLWPARKPVRRGSNPLVWFFQELKHRLKGFPVNPDFLTPLATEHDLPGSIVIYPEIVSGNPLKADHVVRWLLHKPGFHTGQVNYGANDLFFYFNKAFDDSTLNPNPDHQLQVVHLLTSIYQQTNNGHRSGTCYLVRKGGQRDLIHHEDKDIRVDKMSHEERARIFNTCETFISYDMHSLYSAYAALCGCRSIVIPEPGLTKEAWLPDEKERYGIAYGMDDMDWAASTLTLLKKRFADLEQASIDSVQNFVRKAGDYFANR